MLIIALFNVLNFTLRNVIITAGTSTFAFTKDTFKENKQIKLYVLAFEIFLHTHAVSEI